jgi:predicted acylesterase/phospholipase RssA/CRP-like cAMP-binding protein
MTELTQSQKDKVLKIKNSILFRSCADSILQDISNELTDITLLKGNTLFKEGSVGDLLYILVSGRLAIYTRDKKGEKVVIDEKLPGSSVGEIALLTGQLRTASVEAIEDSTLMALSKEGFWQLAEKNPAILAVIKEAILPNLQGGYLARILAELFDSPDMTGLYELQSEMEWLTLAKGQTLFRQGDPGDGMYIVVTGRLQIFIQDSAGKEHLHSEVGSGEVVGEMALINASARSATIYAIRETNLVKLSNQTFEQLINQYPRLMIQVTKMIVNRQQQMLTNKIGNTRSYNYVLVPLSENLDLDKLLFSLGQSMSVFGTVLTLNSNKFNQLYAVNNTANTPLDSPLSFVVNKCLTDLAARYKYLIYQADFGWTNWTQRCISQADRILLVADAKDDCSLRQIEETIQKLYDKIRVELVLVHPKDTKQPSNTKDWLSKRQVFSYHHIRQNDDLHTRKLARYLTNNAIGLVLSGGGARGFAHVGVLKAFREMGIEFDAIGGTSMGSLIGAVYAYKLDSEAFTDLCIKFASSKQLFDFTLPIVSLMSSGKMTNVMEELFGDILIEDLWNPFFCVSSNLSQAKAIVHREGLLRRAVRASVSIPVVFSPIIFDGDVVVDGGVMNNFPVDIMRNLCEGGTVIGISVTPPSDKVHTFGQTDSVSGWKVLLNKLNPLSEKEAVPSLIWTVLRSLEVNNVNLQNQMNDLADLFINPNLNEFGILDFGSFEPIIKIGYETALPKLKEWKPKYLARYVSR